MRRRSGLRIYVGFLIDVALAGLLIAVGPLPVKILFGYYLFGSFLSLTPLGRRYVTLAPKGLDVRLWLLFRIPYEDIKRVTPLPARSIGKKILTTFVGAGSIHSDIEIALKRTRWVFIPFPLPAVFPTRRLWLPVKDDAPLAEALTRRLSEVPNGRSSS